MGNTGQPKSINEIIDLRAPHLSDEGHNPTQSGVSYPPVETPVLIVGGGPVGLLCSILLARCGIRSTILERHANRLGHPKSHVINPRSTEIMRQAGLDIKRLRNLGASPADAEVVRFATSMAGLELGSIPFDKQGETALTFTPEPLFNIPQPLLEDYLYEVVIQTGKVTLWREAQWQSSDKTTDGNELSRILNRRTNTIFEYRSKYLLCCDGANARSREQLQIPFPPLDSNPAKPLHHASVHINADLRKMKSGILWWIWSLSQIGTFISYDRSSSWVFVITFDPLVTPKTTFTEDFCRAQIDKVHCKSYVKAL
jgi:2,4-dichlorophenol 6-monooxygenase